MPKSLLELIKCRWREFRREPSAFFFVILMPILWMAILGFSFSESGNVRIGVGLDDTAAGNFKDVLAKEEKIRLATGNEDELLREMQRGNIAILVQGQAGNVTYQFDKKNPQAVLGKYMVDQALQEAAGQPRPVITEDKPVLLKGSRYIDFLIPGLLALSIMTSSLFGTGMTIVSHRRESLLKRFLATPMPPIHYIFSHLVGRCFVLAVEMTAIIVSGILLFGFEIQGSVIAFVFFAVLGTAAFTSFAILAGARTDNTASMNGVSNLVIFPMMFLSGVWFSRSDFPDWMKTIAELLPLTPLVDGLRMIALEGASITALTSQIAILLAYIVISSIAAVRIFKWY